MLRLILELLFKEPEYEIDPAETLEGKTMIFIKRLNTLAKLNKKKEDQMAEVLVRETAKLNVVALTLARRRHDKHLELIETVQWMQRLHRGNICRKKWLRIIFEHKHFGKAKPV